MDKEQMTDYQRRDKAVLEGRKRSGTCVWGGCGRPARPGGVRCEAHTARTNELSRLRRIRYRSEGRCITCGRPAVSGNTLCARHGAVALAGAREQLRRRKEAGLCRVCGSGRAERRSGECASCWLQVQANSRQLRARLKEAGLCYRCGQKRAVPALAGRTRCAYHMEEERRRSRAYLARKRSRGA